MTELTLTKTFAGRNRYIRYSIRYTKVCQINEINSRTGQNTQCDWDRTEAVTGQAQCSVFSQEGIAYNVNRCVDNNVC